MLILLGLVNDFGKVGRFGLLVLAPIHLAVDPVKFCTGVRHGVIAALALILWLRSRLNHFFQCQVPIGILFSSSSLHVQSVV